MLRVFNRVLKNKNISNKSNIFKYGLINNNNHQVNNVQIRMYETFDTYAHNLNSGWTESATLWKWIDEWTKLVVPDRVHLCDGSKEEYNELLRLMVSTGTLIACNQEKRPGCYLARSPPSDVARVEESTYICSELEEDAGPTNNWRDPEKIARDMEALYDGCMRGRTMYVVPFVMGPVGSEFSHIGVQITDSPYAVASMRIMTRMGKPALDMLGSSSQFIPCVHSVGMPLMRQQEEHPWPSNPNHKHIAHFPEQRRIWSYGSGYGGNALLGKKCFALRIASSMAREDGWLAEHMLIVGITNPDGIKKYFAAAFPSACGKTNLAMMLPKVPGWKIECVGDDIAWMRVGKDGRLWAINPEAGFFGVAPGTSERSNPHALATLSKNTIFTNVAMTKDGDVWWEEMTKEAPSELVSWKRTFWTPRTNTVAAHPNARFTVPASQCPVIDPEWENPNGVPIEGIIFGGRRSTTIPLVYQAFDWEHGTFIGATMNSETTAAAAGKRGVLRADPMAMKPFCGYNMADYFAHWLSFSKRSDATKLPKIFHVNWFRKSKEGKFLWPGFGDNIRVLEWIFKRCDEEATETSLAKKTPIGFLPTDGAIDTTGLDVSSETMAELLDLNIHELTTNLKKDRDFLKTFKDRLPDGIKAQAEALKERLEKVDNN